MLWIWRLLTSRTSSERLCLPVIWDSVAVIRWEVTVKLSKNIRAAESVARVSKMASENISFAGGVHCCPNIFFFRPASLYCEEYVYIRISDCVETAYELPLLPNKTANELFLLKSGAVQSIDWRQPGGDWANMWHWKESYIYWTVHHCNTGCPTRYRTQHLLIILTPMKILQRNLNGNTFVVWEMKRNVSVVRFKFRCNIVISDKIIKEMPGLVPSGTHCSWKQKTNLMSLAIFISLLMRSTCFGH